MIPVIDMHCDTIEALMHKKQRGEAVSLRSNALHADLLRMKKAGYMCQCFALFTNLADMRKSGTDPYLFAKALSDLLDEEVRKNAALIRPAYSASDILKNAGEGFMSALKTIEEGAVYGGDPARIREFYRMGVRMSTLTWNYENELAWPNRVVPGSRMEDSVFVPETEMGLKKAGRDAVLLMEELGMLIDISHLGDAGISGVFETVRPETPVIASHANARSVTGNPRNLTDQMLRKIAEHGGVTGITFSPHFLSGPDADTSRIGDILRHIQYIYRTATVDIIGLGSDFDGISCALELDGAGSMQKLADALSCAGFTAGEIEKIFFGNVLRVCRQVLG